MSIQWKHYYLHFILTSWILRKRFGFDGEEPMILNDIGETLNITRERTRQLQENIFKKIRKKNKIILDQGKQFV
jgi:DNA-directed RNA polymerase sigma subunit (sigma70/sigma32)